MDVCLDTDAFYDLRANFRCMLRGKSWLRHIVCESLGLDQYASLCARSEAETCLRPQWIEELAKSNQRCEAAGVNLNHEQKACFVKIQASRFTLIHGPPGICKTHLAEVVFAGLVEKHPAVLSALSNEAVDNLLRRLSLRNELFSLDPSGRRFIGCVGEGFDADVEPFSVSSWLELLPGAKQKRRKIRKALQVNCRIHVGTLSAFAVPGDPCCLPYVDPSVPYFLVLVDEVAQATEVATYGVLFPLLNGGAGVLIEVSKQLRSFVHGQ